MTDEELELKNLINDCGKAGICPLYSAFWGKPNARKEEILFMNVKVRR